MTNKNKEVVMPSKEQPSSKLQSIKSNGRSKLRGINPKEIKYTQGDLLWECTRRNENYKNDYASMIETYKDINQSDSLLESNILLRISRNEALCSNPTPDDRIMYPTDKGGIRWSIQLVWMSKESPLPRIWFWKDPLIDVYKIKKEIAAGKPITEVHPYGYIDLYQEMIPLNYYHRTYQYFYIPPIVKSIKDQDLCINETDLGDNFLLSISPTASDKSILKAVQKAKKLVLKGIRQEHLYLKEKGETIYNPLKIEQYLGWLKKYDEVVDHLRKLKCDEPLTYEKGACIIPDDFSFSGFLTKKGIKASTTFESQRKSYKRAYDGAVKLIQSTPFIFFSPPKIEKA